MERLEAWTGDNSEGGKFAESAENGNHTEVETVVSTTPDPPVGGKESPKGDIFMKRGCPAQLKFIAPEKKKPEEK